MVITNDVIERILEFKRNMYWLFLENLDEFHLKRSNIEETLKELQKSEKKFVKDMLDLEEVKREGEVVRNFLNKFKRSKKNNNLLNAAIENLKGSKLNKRQRDLISAKLTDSLKLIERNKKILNSIEKSEVLNQNYVKLQKYSYIERILNRYRGMDWLIAFKKIHLYYKENNGYGAALGNLIPLLKEMAENEKNFVINNLQNDTERINEHIKYYNNCIRLPISEKLELSDIFIECLGKLYEKKMPKYKARLQEIEDYKIAHRDWLGRYKDILAMYWKITEGKNYVENERKTVQEVIAKLRKDIKIFIKGEKEKHKNKKLEKDNPQWKGVLKRNKDIINIIKKYSLYNFENQRKEAEEQIKTAKSKLR